MKYKIKKNENYLNFKLTTEILSPEKDLVLLLKQADKSSQRGYIYNPEINLFRLSIKGFRNTPVELINKELVSEILENKVLIK